MELTIELERMRKSFDKDFAKVTQKYVEEIRNIKERYKFGPIGGEKNERD